MNNELLRRICAQGRRILCEQDLAEFRRNLRSPWAAFVAWLRRTP